MLTRRFSSPLTSQDIEPRNVFSLRPLSSIEAPSQRRWIPGTVQSSVTPFTVSHWGPVVGKVVGGTRYSLTVTCGFSTAFFCCPSAVVKATKETLHFKCSVCFSLGVYTLFVYWIWFAEAVSYKVMHLPQISSLVQSIFLMPKDMITI